MISKGNNHVFVKIVFFRFCNLQCYCNACLIIIQNLSVGRKIKNKLRNSKFLAYKQSSCLVFVCTGKCSFSSWFFYTFSYLKKFFQTFMLFMSSQGKKEVTFAKIYSFLIFVKNRNNLSVLDHVSIIKAD